MGQVRHAGNRSTVPEEGSVAGIRVVPVGRLNPCNGRKGGRERGSQKGLLRLAVRPPRTLPGPVAEHWVL